MGELRNGSLTTRALLPAADSPAQIPPPPPVGKPAPPTPPERSGETFLRIALDRVTVMQLRELRWGDPFHPAGPEELAAVVSALLPRVVPAFLMRR